NLALVISGHAELLMEQLEDGGARHSVDEGRRASEQASELTLQLLAFSPRQFLHPVDLDVSDVVAGLVPMLGRLIGEDIELSADLRPRLGAVRADPAPLRPGVM